MPVIQQTPSWAGHVLWTFDFDGDDPAAFHTIVGRVVSGSNSGDFLTSTFFPKTGWSTPEVVKRELELSSQIYKGEDEKPRTYVEVDEGYEPLFLELMTALQQLQRGKGVERHARNLTFMDQPIITLSKLCGAGGPAQQVMKKTQEAMGMHTRGEHDAAIAELHGAMNYLAATILTIKGVKG